MQRRTDYNLPARLTPAVARFLAVVCVWLGTGGVLHHTDDLVFSYFANTRPAVHHATAALPIDDCAACEWTQGLQTGAAAAVVAVAPTQSVASYSCRAVSRLLPKISLHTPPRAPPTFCS